MQVISNFYKILKILNLIKYDVQQLFSCKLLALKIESAENVQQSASKPVLEYSLNERQVIKL